MNDKSTNKKESKLTYFIKMFTFMRPFMPVYIPGLILYCSQGFVFPLITSVFVSKVTAQVLAADVKGIILAALVYVGMYAAIMPLLAVGVVTYTTSLMKATKSLKTSLFRRFVKTSLEDSMSSHSGEGIAAINTDADTAADVYGNSLSPFLSSVISIVFSSIVVFVVDYRLGLASVAIGLMAFVIQYKFAKPLGVIGSKSLSANAASVKAMSNIFSGALAIRAFNAQRYAIVSFDKENSELRRLSFTKAQLSMWQDFFTSIQGWLSISGVFAFGGYLVATGRLSFPQLMMVPVMCESIGFGMARIGGAWAALQAPIEASKRVFAILEKGIDGAGKEDDSAESNRRRLKAPVLPKNESTAETSGYALKMSGLNFRYMSAKEDSLSEINLEIGENEMVAFVGESGSGKSTLLRTMIGMYDRDKIRMSIGGLHFNKGNMLEWRKKFAYVDQSCKLFNMSIADNISLGAANSINKPNIDDVKQAAAAAYADGFISGLAEGYDTQCGEKGASISGGQKQRIAIARALVRNAPVLVFDEATSALDTDSERQVMETINSLRGNHTILITTHNLNNIVTADRIVVMDKGRIAETGRHEDLMKKNGLYKRLFQRSQKE